MVEVNADWRKRHRGQYALSQIARQGVSRYPVSMLYLIAIFLSLCVSIVRSSWPVRLILSTACAMTALAVFSDAQIRSDWIQAIWMPLESFALLLTAAGLTAALLKETEHRDRWVRFSFRVGVICIPLAIAGTIWLFDPHNTLVTVFYAGRARFWQGMMLAWFIAWCNTGWGKRMSLDGILCLGICICRGIAVSFPPSDHGQMIFRVVMSLVLLSWSTRYPVRGGLPVLPLPRQPSPIPLAGSLPGRA